MAVNRTNDDFTNLHSATLNEIVHNLQDELQTVSENRLEKYTAVLLHRSLFLLRSGSRDQLLTESLALDELLSSDDSKRVKQDSPQTFGEWLGLSKLLTEAARRTDEAAASSIVLSHREHAKKVLMALCEREQPWARAELRGRVGISESHFSHLLADLEEAELIRRYRAQEGKETLVELGLNGEKLFKSQYRPKWTRILCDAIRSLDFQSETDLGTLKEELVQNGASSIVANECVEAIKTAEINASPMQRVESKMEQVMTKTVQIMHDRFQDILHRLEQQMRRSFFEDTAQRGTILVIGQGAQLNRFLAQSLEAKSYKLLCADAWPQAAELARQEPHIDRIIFHGPHIDATKISRVIREHSDVSVMFISPGVTGETILFEGRAEAIKATTRTSPGRLFGRIKDKVHEKW
jgi:DNA-binding MarR family transcriptional regulator